MSSYERLPTDDPDDGLLTSETKRPNVSTLRQMSTDSMQPAERRKTRLNSHLLTAVQNGDSEAVKKYLQQGASSNATCRKTKTSAVQIASLFGHDAVLTELLSFGGPVRLDYTDSRGCTALHYAAYTGNMKCVEQLLRIKKKRTANLNRPVNADAFNNFAEKATLDNLEHECEYLMQFIPEFVIGSTALHLACKQAHAGVVALLLQAGADVKAKDSRDLLPLNVVAEDFLKSEIKIDAKSVRFTVSFLLDKGAEFRTNNQPDLIPLHTCISLDCCDALNLLLRKTDRPCAPNVTGETPLHTAILWQHEEALKQLIDISVSRRIGINSTNSFGYTPFQLAVERQWAAGISMLMEAGANVCDVTRDGDTALHIAAATGNLELLEEILDERDTVQIINLPNKLEETALFCSIKSGNVKCVEILLQNGAEVTAKLPGNVTVLHRTAEYGYNDILEELLKVHFDKRTRNAWLDERNTLPMSGMTALHLAAYNDRQDCVRTLLSNGCDQNKRTTDQPHNESLALHLAADRGHTAVVKLLLEHDDAFIVNKRNAKGWNALHLAAYNSHRECVKLLLTPPYGGDLSSITHCDGYEKTAVDIIMHCISRPTDFLDEVFTDSISSNESDLHKPNCMITVRYDVLAPRKHKATPNSFVGEMNVLKALLNTGNRFGQKRLLLHPVIESFLHLKWRTLCVFYYTMLFIYAMFVLSLTIIATSLYYYETNVTSTFNFDTDTESLHYYENNITAIKTVNRIVWSWIMFVAVVCIVLQEFLQAQQYLLRYICEVETWVKWSALMLSVIVVSVDHSRDHTHDWARHVTTVAILLAWIELMFLFSRFPVWGYYVLMFFKVAKNVVKVLLTFLFLVIGFSLSFLIEFQTTEPFNTPWNAFVKTIVMMTSEFDYEGLFDKPEDEKWATSLFIGRVMFVAFLVLASIVLMNLMVGLAVNDINGLEIQGKIQRLAKQVTFLSALDQLVSIRSVKRVLPRYFQKKMQCDIEGSISIYPGRPLNADNKKLPRDIKESLIEKMFEQEQTTMLNLLKDITRKLDEMQNRKCV